MGQYSRGRLSHAVRTSALAGGALNHYGCAAGVLDCVLLDTRSPLTGPLLSSSPVQANLFCPLDASQCYYVRLSWQHSFVYLQLFGACAESLSLSLPVRGLVDTH